MEGPKELNICYALVIFRSELLSDLDLAYVRQYMKRLQEEIPWVFVRRACMQWPAGRNGLNSSCTIESMTYTLYALVLFCSVTYSYLYWIHHVLLHRRYLCENYYYCHLSMLNLLLSLFNIYPCIIYYYCLSLIYYHRSIAMCHILILLFILL